MTGQMIELAREKGDNFRVVRIVLEEDGAISLEAQDMGQKVEEFWGEDEYEFRVRVAPSALPRLAFELLREKFAGDTRAVDRFQDWCKARGVAHEFSNWV
jgi:hypothetical protein